jgi:hypothetical protein
LGSTSLKIIMATKKITELTNLATPVGADVLPIVDDVAGTPTTKKVTATNLMTLAPVQSVAGQTGTVTLSNTDISGLGTAATQDVGTSASNVVQLDGTAKLPAVDGSQLTNLPSGSVEGTAVLSTGETGGTKFLREDGDGTCSFQTVTVTDDNFRGTDNPHIGAFPNQSFLVIDNPFQSAFLAARQDGEISVITNAGAEVLSKGFSIVEDSSEPDIEAVGTLHGSTENYSVISGDSDSKGANGLPIRQGFNLPDIGANPSPILISGGSIA